MKNITGKILFHKDSILLAGLIFTLWVSVNTLVDISTAVQKLQPHTGKLSQMNVVITHVKHKPLYKDTTWELRLALVGEPRFYTLSAKHNFDGITSIVTTGDTITIYTKSKVLGIFGFGGNHTITHLATHRNKKVLVDYNQKRVHYKSFVLLPILTTAGLLLWYIFRVRKRLWWQLEGYKKKQGVIAE